jgi:hypothetical protein
MSNWFNEYGFLVSPLLWWIYKDKTRDENILNSAKEHGAKRVSIKRGGTAIGNKVGSISTGDSEYDVEF